MKRLSIGLAIALLASCLLVGSTSAQFGGFGGVPAGVSSPNAMPIQGTPNGVPLPVSATISGFTATTVGAPITATTLGVTGSLPVGATVVVSNVGTTNVAYCALGAAATTSAQPIAPNGGWFAFTVGAATQITCATAASTTTVNLVGGTGIPTGTGGGGGSGSVTQGTTPWVDQLVSGGNMDAPGVNAVAPSSEFIIGGVYQGSPPTLTNGRASPLLLDANGNLQISSPSLLAAISSPLTPCTAADCSLENPVGPVLINGTLPAFAATPTFNIGATNGVTLVPCVTSSCADANPVGNVLSNVLAATVTTPVASPGMVNWANHGLVANQAVTFSVSGGVLPTGLTAGTTYYVLAAGLAANVFEVATTIGGAAINFTVSSTGTQTAVALQTGPLGQGFVADFTAAAPALNPGAFAPYAMDKAQQLRVGNGSFVITPNVGAPNVTNVSHAPGSVLGTKNGAVTQPVQFLKTGDQGEVASIIVSSTAAVTVGLKAWVFNSFPSTAFTEASAMPALSAADLQKVAGVVDLAPPDSSSGGTTTVWKSPLGTRIPIANSAAVYIILVVTGSSSFTPAANSIGIVVGGRY